MTLQLEAAQQKHAARLLAKLAHSEVNGYWQRCRSSTNENRSLRQNITSTDCCLTFITSAVTDFCFGTDTGLANHQD